MKASNALIAVLVLGVVHQSSVSGQISAESAPGEVACLPESAKLVDEWKKLYLGGRWGSLVESMEKTLTASMASSWKLCKEKESCTAVPEAFIVAFPSKRLGEKEPTLLRVILDAERPYAKYLTGVRRVREIVVAPSAETRVSSVYWYQDAKNPAEAAWIELTKKLPLAGISSIAEDRFRDFGRKGRDKDDKECDGAWSHFTDLNLPGVRGKVIAETVLALPTTAADYADAAPELDRSLQSGGARLSACAQKVASTLADLTTTGAIEKDKELLLAKYESVLKTQVCTDELTGPPELVVARSAEVQASYAAFVDLLSPAVIKSATEIEDVPLQRWSLGILAAAAVDESGADRAKIDSGKVARDPLGGVLSIGAVYFHPVAFDSRTSKPTPAERWRIFIGGVLTPDPGLSVGVAFQLFRGLTLNAGFAFLQVNSPKDGVNFGDSAEGADSPLHRARRDVAIVAFGYSF